MALVEQIRHEIRSITTGKYPDFIWSRRKRLDWDYVPVFAFHSIEPAEFERKIAHLQANGYQTVFLDDVVRHVRGDHSLPDRSVAITIDDGRLSTWSVAFPILRKYGMCATAFVIPGYVDSAERFRPTLDDGPASAIWRSAANDRASVMSWLEVSELHRSGVIAIESHSMLHRMVYTDDGCVDFLNPELEEPIFKIPMDPSRRKGWSREELLTRLGTPLFSRAQILETESAYVPNPDVVAACRQWVSRRGGEDFFRQPRKRWRRALQDVVERAGGEGSYVDTEAAQRWEISAAKRQLEERLPGKTVKHFCYPRAAGSDRANRLLRDTGHESCVWGIRPAASSNRPGCDPFQIGRLKHDFVQCLPGRGRKHFGQIYAEKARRRFRGETGF